MSCRIPCSYKGFMGNYDAATKNLLAEGCYDEGGVTKMGWGLYEIDVWYPQAGQVKNDLTTHKTESLYWTSTVASNGWIRVLSLQPGKGETNVKGVNTTTSLNTGYIRCVKE